MMLLRIVSRTPIPNALRDCFGGPWHRAVLACFILLAASLTLAPGAVAAKQDAPPGAATLAADVRQYVTFRLRQEKLITKGKFHPLTADEASELASLEPQATGIRDKYLFTPARDTFNKQANKLYKDEIGPALRPLLEDEFPDVQQVMAAYPDETERLIAIIVMRDFLLGANGNWSRGKAAGYNKALEDIQAEETRRGVRLASDGLTADQRTLVRRATSSVFRDSDARAFLHKLYARFIPGEVAQIEKEQATAKDVSNRPGFQLAILVIGLLTFVLVLVAPWYLAAKLNPEPTTEPAEPSAPSSGEAMELGLPESLRRVRLKRLEYPVVLQTGLIIEEKTIVQEQVRHFTTGGHTSVVGNQVVSHPFQHHTTTTITTKDRIWLRTLENEEKVWTFRGVDMLARTGHIISILTTSGKRGGLTALLAYNHGTNKLEDFDFNTLRSTHRLSVWKLWLVSVAIGAIGGFVTGQLAVHASARADPPMTVLLVTTVAAAILGGISSLVLKWLVQFRRNRAFRRHYLPAYREFLVRVTPALENFFRPERA